MKKHNLNDIAKLAGVSVTTVHRALSGKGYVSSTVRAKIFKAASQLGYTPNGAVNKKRIGVVISQYEHNNCNFYRDTMLAEISRRCSELDIGIEIVFPRNIETLEENFVREALVFQQLEPEAFKKAPNVNFVSINNTLKNAPVVSTDNRWCIESGVNYLLQHGCKRIMLIVPNCDGQSAAERCDLFSECMKKAGMFYDILDLDNCVSVAETLKQAVTEKKIDAFFIGGEDMAPMINWELNRLGFKIPDDFSLLSFEAPGSSCYMIPPHTTVQQDFPRLVSTALEWLMKIAEGQTLPANHRLLLPGIFNERESVKSIK